MNEIVRGDRSLAELADGRARTSIRDWRENGCPHSICPDDEKTILYVLEDVLEWCGSRDINFYDKENAESEDIKFHKLRQEKHKANEMEHKERLRKKEFAPVSEFEQTTVVLLQQVKRLMVEVVGEIKKEARVKGKAAEEIDAMLITGFNKIADIDLSE